ncbi:excinuclease ABC subunit UvrC, partial [Streptomyces albidoflavus]
AGRLRDHLWARRRPSDMSAEVLADATDADLIAVAEDELEAAVQIFHVRGGRVRGQRGWVTDKVEAVDTAGLVGHALQQLYGEERGEGVPKEVLVPALPENTEAVSQWLGDRRGTQVSLRIPQRGDKKSLMETVQRNAQQSLVLHKTRRASDLTTRSRALEEIAEALELDSAPLRIECYDISHFQGDDVVASMVVFEDGLARKSEYRRFQIKGRAGDTQLWHGQGQDDVRSMHEVITRRFRRYLSDRERTGEWTEEQDATEGGEVTASLTDEDGRPKRFAYPPQLVVVDGGQPQVAAAQRALDELGIDDIAVCGLAKRLEEVWVPGQDDPVVLPRTSEGLYLLQRIRDEAHRFAITYQRAKRSKRIRTSPLDDVPGLGETRKQALVKHFGSVRKLRAATVEQICEVPGIGRKTALAVAATLAQSAPSVAVNTATGEIVGDDDTDESPERGEAPATPGESDGPDTVGGTGPSTPESRGADRPASGSEGEQDSPADGSAQGDGPSAESVEGEPVGSGEAEPGAEGPGGPLAAGLPQDEPAPQESAPAPPALGPPQDGPRSHGDALPLVHPAPSAPQPGDARTARVPEEGDAPPIQGVAPQPVQGEAAPGEGVAAGPGGNSPDPHRAAGSPDGGAAGQTGDPEVSGPAEQERPGDRTAPDGGPDQAPPQTAPKNRGQQT